MGTIRVAKRHTLLATVKSAMPMRLCQSDSVATKQCHLGFFFLTIVWIGNTNHIIFSVFDDLQTLKSGKHNSIFNGVGRGTIDNASTTGEVSVLSHAIGFWIFTFVLL